MHTLPKILAKIKEGKNVSISYNIPFVLLTDEVGKALNLAECFNRAILNISIFN
tara:strand:- start:110 stop:271 length:162 start_codon:yes stop_codon:yes gene_type:complete